MRNVTYGIVARNEENIATHPEPPISQFYNNLRIEEKIILTQERVPMAALGGGTYDEGNQNPRICIDSIQSAWP